MRYETSIVFVEKGQKVYDPEISGYRPGEDKKTKTLANVTDLGTSRSVQLFGDIKQGAKVIRLYPSFDVPKHDYIELWDKTWQTVTSKQPLNRHDLIVQEVTVS